MRASSSQELKQELSSLKPSELVELSLRLARFKKENKELLSYLLFEAHDEEEFIEGVKREIEELFGGINHSQLYFAKKTLRKIVRIINKYSRYSGIKQTDLEMRLFFCLKLKGSGIPFRQNPVISNLYNNQVKKIEANLSSLHEDLQHDYSKQIAEIKLN